MMSGASAAHEWSFRDEALAATHRWHLIVLFCLVGSLAGWLVSLVWPSPHRATKELFVGLNVGRSADDRNAAEHAGLPFSNVNDYKNWQMSSLNSVIYMDSILDETLSRLRLVDPYWQSVSRQDLALMLHVYWRNAGKWRLVAEHDDSVRAAQAVVAWQDVVVEQVHAAVAQAQSALLLSDELKATMDEKARAVSQLAAYAQIQDDLQTWQAASADRPADEVLAESERLLLQQSLIQTSQGTVWQALLETFPVPGSSNDAYVAWIERVMPLLDASIQGSQGWVDALEQRQPELKAQYIDASNGSLGLSAELLVQKISDRKLEQTTVRPTGVAILVGAGVGLILWALIWLVAPALRMKA
jgi:hypothetical protein